MSQSPGGWIDKVMGWCFAILAATIALSCAVSLIEAMWPVLRIIIGVVGTAGIVVGAIVVFRTWRNGW